MHPDEPKDTPIVRKPNPIALFWLFFRISLTTPGGGYAIVAVLSRELIRKGWVNQEFMTRALGIAQSVPGPIAITVSLLVARRIGGWKPVCAAICGISIPPLFIVIGIAVLLGGLDPSPIVDGAMSGAYASAVGFVGGMLYRMLRPFFQQPARLIVILSGISLSVLFPSLGLPLSAIITILVYLRYP